MCEILAFLCNLCQILPWGWISSIFCFSCIYGAHISLSDACCPIMSGCEYLRGECLESPDYSMFNPPHRADRRRQYWTSNQRRGRQHLCSKLVPGNMVMDEPAKPSSIKPHHCSPFWVAKAITPRSKEIIRRHKTCLFNHDSSKQRACTKAWYPR